MAMQFVDLKYQYQIYKEEIHKEIDKVLSSAAFIRGPAVAELEQSLAEFVGVKHAIGCASGTDALLIGLMAEGVKPGDEIIVPDFTFVATAEVIVLLGGTPVFADILPKSFCIDPESIQKCVTGKTVGVIPVSLYGQCADFFSIQEIANKHGLWILEDGAQSFGATYRGKKSCGITQLGATSFFPAKPLGCYGDGGAIFTNDDELAEKLRMILNHGQEKRYLHTTIGLNARLDTLQAAIVQVKLRHFEREIENRQHVAGMYTDALQGIVETPTVEKGNTSVWAQYTIMTDRRDDLAAGLKERGIPTAIHYPRPLHSQPALAYLGGADSDNPVSVRASKRVLSLPMHPFLTEKEVAFIAGSVREIVGG